MGVLEMSHHRLTVFRADAVLSLRGRVLECSSSHAHSCLFPHLLPHSALVGSLLVSTTGTCDLLCSAIIVLDPGLGHGTKVSPVAQP